MSEFLSTREAAEYLGFSQITLRKWRCVSVNKGPQFVKAGAGHVRYRRDDLDQWIAANTKERKESE